MSNLSNLQARIDAYDRDTSLRRKAVAAERHLVAIGQLLKWQHDAVEVNRLYREWQVAMARRDKAVRAWQRSSVPAPRAPSIRLATPPVRKAPSQARAMGAFVVKAVSEDRREFSGLASVEEVDRVGDIVVAKGARYQLPLPLLMHHDHKSPVGRIERAAVTKDGLAIEAKIPEVREPGRLQEMVNLAWHSIKYRLVTGLSIGFRPTEFEPIDGGGLKYTKFDLFEISLVAVPACASAQITGTRAA